MVAFIFLSLAAVGVMFYTEMSQWGEKIVRVGRVCARGGGQIDAEHDPKGWNSLKKALFGFEHIQFLVFSK